MTGKRKPGSLQHGSDNIRKAEAVAGDQTNGASLLSREFKGAARKARQGATGPKCITLPTSESGAEC